jgi:phospholipid/cholesterol/gamma-HCH transport system substrate-binding protein
MKPEAKVGLLFLATVLFLVGFIYYLGFMDTLSGAKELNIAYNFAGGIEVGSPVRVMGIKVGKVRSIDFKPNQVLKSGEEVKLNIKVSIENKAWKTLKEDSQYFINIAGVIGEKFIEVSPGSIASAELKDGQVVRGVDPPRIDQLISQSYGLAGEVMKMLKDNKTSVVDLITNINDLVKNLNGLMSKVDKLEQRKELKDLIGHLALIAKDAAYFSRSLRTPQNEKTFQLVRKLLWRLDGLDKTSIKKFLQEEGIKAKLF